MTDDAAALNRIAEVLERGAETALLQTPAGQFAILVVGAVLGAILTYLLRKRLQQEAVAHAEREQKRRREAQRSLLVSLLGDEIALRWNRLIARDLQEVFQTYTLDNVRILCDTRFQPEDLYVFQQCAKDVGLTTAFDDNAVVSHVIYVHILAKDFCDGLNTLRQRYNAHDVRTRVNPPEATAGTAPEERDRDEIGSVLKGTWEDLKRTFYEMDRQMLAIFGRIEKSYSEYIESSGFLREQQIDASAVRQRLEAAARERVPSTSVRRSTSA